jgi:Zn-dependent M28 family amino/carboxypeptidase
MKRFLCLALVAIGFLNISNAQTYNPYYGNIVSNVSSSNILNDLTSFENFGVKEVGTTALTSAENWITARYQSLGYTAIVEQPFTYSAGTSNNIIVTKTGTVYPNTYIIIDAHYDTINGPGTNDNGSGTVLIMELARLLKDVDTEYSIKFIHFSGEEDGLIGSNYYVNNTVIPQNLDIKLVFNIDEVGGVNGMTNNTIVCEQDTESPSSNNAASTAATNTLATCMTLYSNLITEISNAYASDYMPFENNGNIITGLYEKNESPVNHTANDNLVNMDPTYAYEVTKGAVGAALEFAVAYDTLNTENLDTLGATISLYPNPTHSIITISFNSPLENEISFKLIDLQGKEVLQTTLTEQSQQISLDSLSNASYFAVFETGNQRFIKKVVLN